MTVTSPKGEKDGKGTRVIPLFPELRAVLEEAWELTPEGAVYVINERYRKAAMGPNGWLNVNLRTTFKKIVKRAGLKPWPRLFHAMRASRETELCQQHSLHTVVAWLGNTPKIALKHYLMVTDADFEKAIRPTGGRMALHNCMQQPAEPAGKHLQANRAGMKKPREMPGFAASYNALLGAEVAAVGLEPTTRGL